MQKGLFFLLFVFCCFLNLGVMASDSTDFVVIEATNSGDIKPGKTFSLNTKIDIPENGSITVMDASGRKHNIKGPFSDFLKVENLISANAEQQNMLLRISSVLSAAFSDDNLKQFFASADFLKFRALNLKKNPPTWAFDIDSNDNNFCIDKDETPKLWRKDAENRIKIDITDKNGENKKSLTWEKDETTIDWPSNINISNEASYKLNFNGETKTLILHQTPNLPTRMHQADWLSSKGCKSQAVLLLLDSAIDNMLDDITREGKF